MKRKLKSNNQIFDILKLYFDEDKYLKHNPDVAVAIKSHKIKNAFEHFRKYGCNELLLKRRVNKAIPCYQYTPPLFNKKIQDKARQFTIRPKISIIIPTYNIDPAWLELAINSVKQQWYENWEICIVDDASSNKDTINYLNQLNNYDHPNIHIKYLSSNQGISEASNAAITLATGEYIALLDHDDELTVDALYETVKAINETNADFIYTDEDFINPDGKHVNPHFKPDYSPDLLLSHNYITHFACIRKTLIEQVGPFNSKFDGCQDYDLFLRITEKTSQIHHIPKVLYHWRMLESSTSSNHNAKPDAPKRAKIALEQALTRRNIKGCVIENNLPHFFRVQYKVNENPLVSIIIPFKDKPKLLKNCLYSILEKSSYKNYEIIAINNSSQENKTHQEIKKLSNIDPRLKFYNYNKPFNYSKINNYAVSQLAKGKHIILLNNDIQIITSSWIESMLEHSQRKEIACVGAKLYYGNNTIQHAGIIIGLGGYAAHSHRELKRNSAGYFNRVNIIQNISAVTAACLMVKTSIYQELQGLDETNFTVAYNDVDFCLRAIEKGYRNIFTPHAEAYHYESQSRGKEDSIEQAERFNREKNALFNRHKNLILKGDPYYNPNLTHSREDFSLNEQHYGT